MVQPHVGRRGVTWHVRVIANRYADSVRLMSIARAVRERNGVTRCELGMGTPANLGILAGYGAHAEATPGDLVIAVDAHDSAAAEALAWAEQELSSRSQSDDGTGGDGRLRRARPRSVAAAARELDGANVALISVPGEYAALEAHRALTSGMHVFLFSDHVPLEAELELKRRGADLGLLVMGPECGTAMLGGVGLGFANVVRPGPIGIVAAAGTGAQESACLLDAAGVGVSHIVGVGGRDLSAEVGALMFRAGMHMVAGDPGTDTLLHRMGADNMRVRDEHLLNTIFEQSAAYDRVLVVYGSGHWTTLSAALKDRFGKPVILTPAHHARGRISKQR